MNDLDSFWDFDNQIRDYLFDSSLSIAQIANKIGMDQPTLRQRIKQLGLDWVIKKNRKMSRGASALTEMIQKLLPGEEVINEHHIGNKLMLDVYVPSYKLAAEYHGRQHFYYSNLFHKDREDFLAGQRRDEEKIEKCKELGIALLSFRYNDEMTQEAVFDRMLQAIRETEKVKPEKKSNFKGNPYYEKMMQRRREYGKEQYKRFKDWKKTIDR